MIRFTRKFIVNKLPDFPLISKSINIRYYLFSGNGIVIRAQSINNEFEIERKRDIDGIKKESQRISITQEEFIRLGELTNLKVVRETIVYEKYPHIKIRVYKENFDGLIRAEINFKNIDETKEYKPESWIGTEITNTPLAKDESLLILSNEEFQEKLSGVKSS